MKSPRSLRTARPPSGRNSTDAADPVAARRTAVDPDAPAGSARWIAVAGIGHDAGATTMATLLASTYAAHRRYRIVAVDAQPIGGALRSRLGVPGASSVAKVAGAFPELTSFSRLAPFLDHSDDGVWAVTGTAADNPSVLEAREAVAALSGFFAVGVVDCGPVGEPVADALLETADAALLVSPVTAEGVLTTASVLDWLATRQSSGNRWHCAVALVSTVRHPDTDVGQAARLLTGRGGRVVPVPFDAGLLAGRISPRSVTDGTSGAIRRLSTELLSRAVQTGQADG